MTCRLSLMPQWLSEINITSPTFTNLTRHWGSSCFSKDTIWAPACIWYKAMLAMQPRGMGYNALKAPESVLCCQQREAKAFCNAGLSQKHGILKAMLAQLNADTTQTRAVIAHQKILVVPKSVWYCENCDITPCSSNLKSIMYELTQLWL